LTQFSLVFFISATCFDTNGSSSGCHSLNYVSYFPRCLFRKLKQFNCKNKISL